MAENKRNNKINRKKRLIRFTRDLRSHVDSDSLLRTVVRRVTSGERLWRQMAGESDDDSLTADFEGFGDQSVATTTTTEDDEKDDCIASVATEEVEEDVKHSMADEIQRLLRSQWEERVRQWGRQTDDRPTTTTTTTTIGKSILRKARLEVNKSTLERIRRAQALDGLIERSSGGAPHTPSKHKRESKSGQPGFIECVICSQRKYYSHVQRRYGVFSCEPCSKFFARFIKDPKQYFCAKSGDCPMDGISKCLKSMSASRPTRANISGTRCKACWLKVCLQKFAIDSHVRRVIQNNFWPKLETPPNCALITVDTSAGMHSKVASSERISDCRSSQSLLMVAKEPIRASTGPRVKRVCRSARVVGAGLPRATFPPIDGDRDLSDSDSDELPVDVYLCRAYSSGGQQSTTKTSSPKKYRCKECEGCLAEDCGNCSFCRDKKKFGGNNVIKQACRYRTCTKIRGQRVTSTHICDNSIVT